jgi:hypothetical protein
MSFDAVFLGCQRQGKERQRPSETILDSPARDPNAGEAEGAKPGTKPVPEVSVLRRRQPRGDAGAAGNIGNALTRMAVVLLSGVNAVMWEVYTQAPVMAALWAAIAIAFVGWMIYDANR